MSKSGKGAFSAIRAGYTILGEKEKRGLLGVILIIAISGLSSAAMVASIFPFLKVLSDPNLIQSSLFLNFAYKSINFASPYSFLIALAALSLAVICFANIIQIVKVKFVSNFTTNCSKSIGDRLFDNYIRQNYSHFLSRSSHDVSTLILGESLQVVNQFYKPMADIVSAIISVFSICLIIIAMDPVVALLAFLVLGSGYLAFYLFIRTKVATLGRTKIAANKKRYKVVNESLDGIKNIKLYGAENAISESYKTESKIFASALAKTQRMTETPVYFLQIMAFSGIIAICLGVVNAAEFNAGAVTSDLLPTLGVFAFAGQRMMPDLSRLFRSVGQLKFGTPIIEQLNQTLSEMNETTHTKPTSKREKIDFKNYLELKDISFKYPEADLNSLNNINVTFRKGEKIGIAGGSGAGKTTLADILLGLLQPQNGKIVVDGTALTADRLDQWREAVSYVPQQIFLLDTSLKKNIAYGVSDEDIDLDRVWRSIRLAELDKFVVDQLHGDLDAPVGEKGIRLSGGQKQRIGIARALYRGSEIMVLDEATSALDTETEHNVMKSIEAITKNKTLFIIAHRLSTLRECDKILFLKDGEVSAFDSWNSMCEDHAPFQSLIAKSFEGL